VAYEMRPLEEDLSALDDDAAEPLRRARSRSL
jgi:hypothetical protein